MPIQIPCSQCHRPLVVGKQLRCPHCRAICLAQAPVDEPVVLELADEPASPFAEISEDAPAPEFRIPDPHRGDRILLFGILSLFLCWAPPVGLAFATAAQGMAGQDLFKMRRGSMDPAGKTVTRIGSWCGLVGMILSTLFLGLAIYLNLTRPWRR